MEFVTEEIVKDYKFNISTQLEYIGLCADELSSSQEAQDNRLFRYLTIILSTTFKTYLSTSNLDMYLYEPNYKISSAIYYSDFKGYRTGVFTIIQFTNKLNGFNVFNAEDSKEFFYYGWLKDLIKNLNREINTLEKLYNTLNNEWNFKILFHSHLILIIVGFHMVERISVKKRKFWEFKEKCRT